jgi:uncharacterized protein
MSSSNQTLIVKCPNCKRPVTWSAENIFKPFCCERCKLIDLGEWANEEKAIPGDPLTTEIDNEENNFFQ